MSGLEHVQSLGIFQKPPVSIVAGDEVEIEVGTLRNPVVADRRVLTGD